MCPLISHLKTSFRLPYSYYIVRIGCGVWTNAILPVLETVQCKERVSKKVFCGSCLDRDNTAVNFCTDCQKNICSNCLECHKKYKMLQSHTIAELGDITKFIVEKSGKQGMEVDFCVEHPDKAIEYFCEEHGMLLCSSCVIVSHRPCNKVTGLTEMGRDLRNGNEIKKLQTELKAVQPVLERITKALEDNVMQIEEEADALPNRVKELQDKAMKVFDDVYQRVLTQCNNLKKSYTLNVSNEAFNCKSLEAAVESSLITLANVKANGSDIQLFITFHKLEQQMKKYKESLNKMVTDTECTKLELKIDTTLEQAVSQPSHTAKVTAHQFTPDVIAAMKTAMDTEDDGGAMGSSTSGNDGVKNKTASKSSSTATEKAGDLAAAGWMDQNSDVTEQETAIMDDLLKENDRLQSRCRSQSLKYSDLERQNQELKARSSSTATEKAGDLAAAGWMDQNSDVTEQETAIMDDLLKENDRLQSRCRSQSLKYSDLERQNQELKARSDELTAKMASVLEREGHLESADDKFSPSKVAKRFHDIYDTIWQDTWSELEDEFQEEREGITFFSCILEICYEFCQTATDNQIREFLVTNEEEKTPSFRECPEVYQLRKQYGVQEKTTARIIQKIFPKLLKDKNLVKVLDKYTPTCIDIDTDNRRRIALDKYMKACIECCWLVLISTPPLKLEFHVIGRNKSSLKKTFSEYSYGGTIVYDGMDKGDVVEVVWPAVTTEDGEGVYQKGDVLTVSNSPAAPKPKSVEMKPNSVEPKPNSVESLEPKPNSVEMKPNSVEPKPNSVETHFD